MIKDSDNVVLCLMDQSKGAIFGKGKKRLQYQRPTRQPVCGALFSASDFIDHIWTP